MSIKYGGCDPTVWDAKGSPLEGEANPPFTAAEKALLPKSLKSFYGSAYPTASIH